MKVLMLRAGRIVVEEEKVSIRPSIQNEFTNAFSSVDSAGWFVVKNLVVLPNQSGHKSYLIELSWWDTKETNVPYPRCAHCKESTNWD